MTDLVSPIVDIILRLWTCCARHTRYLRKLQQNKNLLSNAMDELKEARDDVQRRVVEAEANPNEPEICNNPVRGWLERVQIIECEVEKILDKADAQLNSARCLGGCCPPNNCWSNYKLGKSIVKKIPLVDELKGKGYFEEVTYRLPIPFVEYMNLELTVGMESMFHEVWSLINSTNDKFTIIGLYGYGGVGKTTLLKKINNEFKTSSSEHGFDHIVIFVVVSKQINYKGIQTTIGKRLGLLDSLQRDENEKSRAHKIFNALTNKNYVLLLDDIWEKVDLQRIGIPIHPQGNSKVILTTRNKPLCGLMEAKHIFQVECLPWDKAWSLFQDKVGEEALNEFQGARGLAELVAKECGGLPLALTALGRAMSTKRSVEEWKDAITTLKNYASEFEGMCDEVLPRLKPSYDYLRNDTIKSCFRYCALYPEDYVIEIAKLVDLWIAEGFLDRFDNLDEARNRGHTIIESLKSACLLESWDDNYVKMHDVIRDLAIWIVNDCRSTDESGRNSSNKYLVAVNPCKKWENAKRIFWDASDSSHSTTRSININEKENPLTSPNLLTLIMVQQRKTENHSLRLSLSFFQHMPLLRVLDLANAQCFDDEFPISICERHELQYLNLSGTSITELPVELRKLVKLKFLVLFNTSKLRRIPAGVIANLSELQFLNLGSDHSNGFNDWELEDGLSFSELDGLKQLQEVHGITISTDVSLEKCLCNRKLQMVCTGLNLTIPSSGRVLDLSNFKSLKRLKLFEGFSELKELVLYGSTATTDGGLLSNIEILILVRLPKFNKIRMGAQPDLLCSHFLSLNCVQIYGCNALKDLTWLVYMENLKELYVCECEGLETIIELGDDGLEGGAEGGDQMLNTGGGGGGGGGGVFRRLRDLFMYGLPKLKSICRHALAFPSIGTIYIVKCLELKKLPLGSGSNVNNTLKQIIGEEEWWNELQWEGETIKSKFLPYYKPERLSHYRYRKLDDHDHDVEADSAI